jgi:hypothetical protein
MHTVVYVPYSSPLLQSEVFLLQKDRFLRSLRAPILHINAQIRRPFATATASAADNSASSSSTVSYREGSIYYINEDFRRHPEPRGRPHREEIKAVIIALLRITLPKIQAAENPGRPTRRPETGQEW